MRWTAAAFNSSNALPQTVANSFRGARVAGEKLQGGRGERVSTGRKPERAGAEAGPPPRSEVHELSVRSCPASVRGVARFLPALSQPSRRTAARFLSAFAQSSRQAAVRFLFEFILITPRHEKVFEKMQNGCNFLGVSCVYIYRGVCDGDIGVPPCPAGGPCRSRGGAAATGLRAVWGARAPAPAEGGHSRSEANAPLPVW